MLEMNEIRLIFAQQTERKISFFVYTLSIIQQQ